MNSLFNKFSNNKSAIEYNVALKCLYQINIISTLSFLLSSKHGLGTRNLRLTKCTITIRQRYEAKGGHSETNVWKFYQIYRTYMKKLKWTKLTITVKVLHVKCLTKVFDSLFMMFWNISKEIIPSGRKILICEKNVSSTIWVLKKLDASHC